MNERWLAVVAVSLLLTQTVTPVKSIQAAVPAVCTTTLQAQIDAAPIGSVLTPEACIYREVVTVTRPLTLLAAPGTEIRGSDVWTNWTPSGGLWVAGPVPPFLIYRDGPKRCADPVTERCRDPEQVYLDGIPLQRVYTTPLPGQFQLDASRNVVLADNPTGRVVEVTVRQKWLRTTANDVIIDGFVMLHAANDAQTGAVDNGGFGNWILRNSTLMFAHGANVAMINGGVGTQLLNNEMSFGGQLGVTVNRRGPGGSLVQWNLIRNNNTAGFAQGWEAGGLKATEQTNLTLNGNVVHNNNGVGLWLDIDCRDAIVSNNRSHHNNREGIFFEISTGASIFDNQVWENGWGVPPPAWTYGGGIIVSTSAGAVVRNNVVAWNARGITVFQQIRRPEDPAPPVINNFVHDNAVMQTERATEGWQYNNFGLAWAHDCTAEPSRCPIFADVSNNRGQNGTYWYPNRETTFIRFEYAGSFTRLADFILTRGDSFGRYLTDAEKTQILTANNMPLAPEPR